MKPLPFIGLPNGPHTRQPPAFEATILLHMNGSDTSQDFIDSSTTGFNVLVTGQAQMDTAQSKFGGASGLFDGSGDYLRILSTTETEVNDDDFSFECWFRISTLTGDKTLYYRGLGLRGQRLYVHADGYLEFNAGDSGGGAWEVTITNSASPQPIKIDTWYHVAITRVGDDFTMYLDGTSVASASWGGIVNSFGRDHYIGADNNGVTDFMNGWIDDFRILVGRSHYLEDFTPPVAELGDPI